MSTPPQQRLSTATRLGYAMGEHTLNLTLSVLSLFYLLFLTEVGGLRPVYAGAVLLLGRTVDAFTDPIMGRISDLTRWRSGRRRPYFLIAALPFGALFALLFVDLPDASQEARFTYYAVTYALWTCASTVLSVPYVALLPELTLDYQERTALSVWRSAAGQVGTMIAALATQPAVRALGGGAESWLVVGVAFGVWNAWPWIVVFCTTRERPEFQRPVAIPFLQGLGQALRHVAYRRLMALYVCSRIAMDVAGALLVFYFTYWIGRPDDFELTMGMLLVAVVASLPFWLRASRDADKRTLFIAGTAWWLLVMLCFTVATPDWPGWVPLLLGGLAGAGYAVADLMPWSMLGEVVDEDELTSSERREGLYAGFFTFLRKLAGASAVFLVSLVLEVSGFVPGGTSAQPESAITAIRYLTGGAPAFFIGLAIWMARAYPITRARHAEIRAALDARRNTESDATPT